MDNLVLLCRTHHRLVHEAGYGVRASNATSNRNIEFTLPNGKIIPRGPDTRSRGNAVTIKMNNQKNGLKINPRTAVPDWYGDQMDNATAVDMLLACE